MPLLAWLANILGGLVGFFLEYFTKKFAILAAVITMFVGLAAAFTAFISGVIAGITATAPAGAVLFGLGLLPDNAEACVSVYISAQFASIIYQYRLKLLDINSRAMLIR